MDVSELTSDKQFLEYSLNILHNLLTEKGLNKEETNNYFNELEKLTGEEILPQNRPIYENARKIYDNMIAKYNASTDMAFDHGYQKDLTNLRDCLLEG